MVVGLDNLPAVLQIERHTTDIGLVNDLGSGQHLQGDRSVDAPGHSHRFLTGIGLIGLAHRDLIGLQQTLGLIIR